jgi:hypothetical protein
MESLITWIGNINLMPFFDSLLSTVTEPFADGFRLLVASFEPYYHALFTREPGLVAGIVFLLFSWSVVAFIKKRFRSKAFITVKKPAVIVRESYPENF